MSRIKQVIKQKMHQFTASFLFRWIVYARSQPLEVTTKSTMVFSPHQDDETLGCGGLIALKRSDSVPVQVVFLTDGRYGRPSWISPAEIVPLRQNEARSALELLGVGSEAIHFLNRVDGSLESLSEVEQNDLVTHMAQLLQTYQPEEIYLPHCRDRHPDHEATFALVKMAVKQAQLQVDLFQYPIWLFWQDPRSLSLTATDLAAAHRLNIGGRKSQKQRAIATYKSQIPGLTQGFLQRFFSAYEVFFKLSA